MSQEDFEFFKKHIETIFVKTLHDVIIKDLKSCEEYTDCPWRRKLECDNGCSFYPPNKDTKEEV